MATPPSHSGESVELRVATGHRLPTPVLVPARRPGSARRTSTVDMVRPQGWDGPLLLTGRSRDLVTTPGGETVADEATMDVTLAPDGTIEHIATTPPRPDIQRFMARSARGGFRKTVHQLLPEDRAADTPLHFLLDDIPVCAMITGYAYVREFGSGAFDAARWGPSIDVCAGWRSGGAVVTEMEQGRRRPVPLGEVAQDLVPTDDPDAWHATGAVPAGGMRRRRRVDVVDGPELLIDAMFRDTFCEADGSETILHEYSVTARALPTTLELRAVTTTAGVLPGPDCRLAVASGTGVEGCTPSEVRAHVLRHMRGNTTCTHLNDLLRSLAAVDRLASYVGAESGG